jgi:hypothetical protein
MHPVKPLPPAALYHGCDLSELGFATTDSLEPLTMKVARSALPVTLAHWERAGVRETVMAAATDFVP